MNLGDFLKNLKLDIWYKVSIVVGAVIIIGSLVFEFKGISNKQGLLLGGALLSFGLGEWSNHTTKQYIKPPNAYTGGTMLLSQNVWQPTIIGILLDGLGIYLGVLFIKSF